MFNDLNKQGAGQVDDIFAETDKPAAQAAASDIETRKVGLAQPEGDMIFKEEQEPDKGGKTLKIIIVILAVLAVAGLAYFAYLQFFQDKAAAPVAEEEETTGQTNTPQNNNNNFVAVIPNATTTAEVPATTTEIQATSTPATTTVPVVPIDSDSDGLSDAEEGLAGTNINVIDTDNDALSDYEEVKIYMTNPLDADTDDDSFLDGAEINNGYNPKGPGKLVDRP